MSSPFRLVQGLTMNYSFKDSIFRLVSASAISKEDNWEFDFSFIDSQNLRSLTSWLSNPKSNEIKAVA